MDSWFSRNAGLFRSCVDPPARPIPGSGYLTLLGKTERKLERDATRDESEGGQAMRVTEQPLRQSVISWPNKARHQRGGQIHLSRRHATSFLPVEAIAPVGPCFIIVLYTLSLSISHPPPPPPPSLLYIELRDIQHVKPIPCQKTCSTTLAPEAAKVSPPLEVAPQTEHENVSSSRAAPS
ncbi:unnamed protein product [Pleuronectes platessa]|uniref:Uncharacterized protein n=1 Tax=Pleuronectes platessa TaxID=8262 RepID=A0A9N7ZB86_PLEPL|nr:unnamed protein product [Pleuronectes platessa]